MANGPGRKSKCEVCFGSQSSAAKNPDGRSYTADFLALYRARFFGAVISLSVPNSSAMRFLDRVLTFTKFETEEEAMSLARYKYGLAGA